MKDTIKNPLLYFLLVPVILSIWPLFVWGIYLPGARESFSKDQTLYKEGEQIITRILELDPERAKLDKEEGRAEFEYSTTVSKETKKCGISSHNYSLSSKLKRKGIQTCRVELKEIGIVQFAEFLSGIVLQWPSLECDKVTIKPVKNKKDVWDIDLDFKYEF